MNILNTKNSIDDADLDKLLDEIRHRLVTAQTAANMAAKSARFSPINELGRRVRTERKKQNLTLNELCELSGVAYATLNKIEHGHSSARLDSINKVASALGMKLWIG